MTGTAAAKTRSRPASIRDANYVRKPDGEIVEMENFDGDVGTETHCDSPSGCHRCWSDCDPDCLCRCDYPDC
jgi:hypothetical protein